MWESRIYIRCDFVSNHEVCLAVAGLVEVALQLRGCLVAPKPKGEGAPETAGTGAVAAQRETRCSALNG